MKRLVILIPFIFLAVIILAQTGEKTKKEIRAEKETKKIEQIKSLIDSGEFVFNATHVLPLGSSGFFLNSSYDLKIKGDSAFAFLPYYGVAYIAEYGGRNGGIEFSEPMSGFKVEPTKTGKQISFKVKAPKDTYKMLLSVSELGYADVQVMCNNRQSIQFYGTIEELEKK